MAAQPAASLACQSSEQAAANAQRHGTGRLVREAACLIQTAHLTVGCDEGTDARVPRP